MTTTGPGAPESAEVDRLVAGTHSDPHALLGAHEHGERTVIRVFRPRAEEVVALVGEDRIVLQPGRSGLFTTTLPFTGLLDYRLQVRDPGRPAAAPVADGYRFLPTLGEVDLQDRKSTRLNSSHVAISYAVFCLKKQKHAHDDVTVSHT